MKASGIAPNLIIYTNLIRAHCQSFDMDNAEQVGKTPPTVPRSGVAA